MRPWILILKPVKSVLRIKSGSAFHNLADMRNWKSVVLIIAQYTFNKLYVGKKIEIMRKRPERELS